MSILPGLPMEISQIAGYSGMVGSLIMSCAGLPYQIYRTHKTGERVSAVLAGGAFLTYSSWSIYGWTKPDDFLAIAQTPGVLFSGIMLIQSLTNKKADGVLLEHK